MNNIFERNNKIIMKKHIFTVKYKNYTILFE